MTQETISLTDAGRKNAAERGLYVHVFNKAVLSAEYAKEFCKITGEVCFSDLGDDLLEQKRSTFGIVMRAKPTASFAFDCWSDVDQHGMRFATAKGNPGRNEHWIVPADAELVALFCDESISAEVDIIAKELGVPVWSTETVYSVSRTEFADSKTDEFAALCRANGLTVCLLFGKATVLMLPENPLSLVADAAATSGVSVDKIDVVRHKDALNDSRICDRSTWTVPSSMLEALCQRITNFY